MNTVPEPVERARNHFDRFAPEQLAVIPPGARSEMTFELTTADRRRRLERINAHITARLARWITRQLMKLNPYAR